MCRYNSSLHISGLQFITMGSKQPSVCKYVVYLLTIGAISACNTLCTLLSHLSVPGCATHTPCASAVITLCSAGHASSPLLTASLSSSFPLNLFTPVLSFPLPAYFLFCIHGIPPEHKQDAFQIWPPSYSTPYTSATCSISLYPRVIRGNLRIISAVLILNKSVNP